MNYHPSVGFAQDRDVVSARSAFKRAAKLEAQYRARLRKVARHVGDIVAGFEWSAATSSLFAQAVLRRYADMLRPWAEAVADRTVKEIAASDRVSWRRMSAQIGRSLRAEIDAAPTGQAMHDSLRRQVDLITSLPLDAARRVHEITTAGIAEGKRASDVAAEILRTGEVTRSRADLIARTEVSRTATELTRARAEHVGSTHFIWRTAGDSDVRPSHRKLNGKAFRWDEPPECDPGHRALPGGIWNCRCYPEVVIPEVN